MLACVTAAAVRWLKFKNPAAPAVRREARGLGTGMKSNEAQKASEAKAELAEILERRPDLKGKSIEAARRVLRREARLSLRPQPGRAGRR